VKKLIDPYLDPEPESTYIFRADDDIYIELGEPIGPFGFDIKMNVLLGDTKEFL